MDNSSLVLFAELGISLNIIAAVIFLLQPVLQGLLREICHGEIRASFWSTFTRLMLLISPLLVVILFSHTLSEYPVSLTRVFRDTLLHALLGQFCGLLIVGGILLNFSRNEQGGQKSQPPRCDALEEK